MFSTSKGTSSSSSRLDDSTASAPSASAAAAASAAPVVVVERRDKRMKKLGSKMLLTNLKGLSTRSCDSNEDLDTNEGGGGGGGGIGVSTRSIFSRLKTGRRPSLVQSTATTTTTQLTVDEAAAVAAAVASVSERGGDIMSDQTSSEEFRKDNKSHSGQHRPSWGGGMVRRVSEQRRSTAVAAEAAALRESDASPPRRASMGRRPSLGGSFTTHRRSERRPSLDTASIARFHEQQQQQQQQNNASAASRFEQDVSSFQNSFTNNSSNNSGQQHHRRPSYATSDNGNGNANAAVPSIMVHPTLCMSAKPLPPKQHVVIEALLASRSKSHMMDVFFIAKDGTKVPTSRYVMACRIESLEEKLYPTVVNDNDSDHNQATVTTTATVPKLLPSEVSLGPYSTTTLEALIEFCFCGEVMTATETCATSVRAMVELAELAFSLQFRVLGDDCYQWARRVMNRHPSMVCVVYDAAASSPLVKEFEQYALQIMEESPIDTLLGDGGNTGNGNGGGIQHLSATRLEELLTDHDMEDVDELLVFRMIARWYKEKGSTAEALKEAQHCAKQVLTLRDIDTAELEGIVRDSGLCDVNDVQAAIQERARNHASSSGRLSMDFDGNNSSSTMGERIEVQGAGIERVNGIYHRQEDQDGQAMFSKGQGPDSIGLFQWEDTWGIGPSFDLSNMFYECISPSKIPPTDGWEVSLQGENPPPHCRWIASRRDSNSEEQDILQRGLPACFRSEEDLYGN